MLDRLIWLGEFFERLRHAKVGHSIVGLIEQSLAIAIKRGMVIFFFEVEIADFNILRRSMRIVRMKLLHTGGIVFSVVRSVIGVWHRTVGMVLGIVRRRGLVNPGIAAGTLARFLIAVRTRRGLILVRILVSRLRLAKAENSQAQINRQKKEGPLHSNIVADREGPAPDHIPNQKALQSGVHTK